MSILDLPSTPVDADPVILPGFSTGLGITPRRVPAWITDPGLIDSIALGFIDIDDDFIGEA